MEQDVGNKGSSGHQSGQSLGEFKVRTLQFEGLPALLQELQGPALLRLNEKQRSERVNQALYELIQKSAPPCFLLPAVIDYIAQVNALKILDSYAFFHFELWLNQYSSLSAEENYRVRAKITGKWVPRDEYQLLFPIGMGKMFPGSHFVTAHASPDLDTTVASFWGWVDAFSARVAEGLHLWNIPGGALHSQIEIQLLFNQILGNTVFDALAKTRTTLALSGIDLMTQKGLSCRHAAESTQLIDHERAQNAIVLVDDQGYYLGDWRNFDVEGVRQVVMLLNDCLRWCANNLHVKLIALFTKEHLSKKDLPAFIQDVFFVKLMDCQPAKECTDKQRKYLQDYLCKVLGVKQGLDCTLEEFAKVMQALSLPDFQACVALVASLHQSSLFDSSGALVENRPLLFNHLQQIIKKLDDAINSIRTFVERLDVALSIKTNVFRYLPQSVSYRADVEEIKSKMGSYPYLSVTATDKDGKLIPVGVVHAHDLHKPLLGDRKSVV